MNTSMMEMNLDEMEQVNGGMNLPAGVVAAILGGVKGALTGGMIGMAAGGPPGAVIGAVVGTLAEGTLVGYMAAGLDEKK